MFDWRARSILPGDTGIRETVFSMIRAVRFAFNDGALRRRAENIIAGSTERDTQEEASRLFDYTRNHYRYTKDPVDIEMLKSPEIADREIDARGFFLGDCDDAAMYLAALLVSVGIPARFSVIAVPGKGGDFRHVYTEGYVNGYWLPMECTAKQKPLGWEAPYSRKESFDI